VRVGLGGVDRNGGLEAADRFGVLASLLVNQAELVLRFAVVGIDCGVIDENFIARRDLLQ